MVDPKVSEKENFGKEVYVDVKAWMRFSPGRRKE